VFGRSLRVQDEAKKRLRELASGMPWAEDAGYPQPNASDAELLKFFLDNVVESDDDCTREIIEKYLDCSEC
jgi:hypothetical protein